jgi:integrase
LNINTPNVQREFLVIEGFIMPKGVTYEHKYKSGKKEELIPFSEIMQKVRVAELPLAHEAFFWILYYTGVRKSEAYERVVDDFAISRNHVSIDFHQRKKGGAKVPPLKLPRKWYGVNRIVEVVQRIQERREKQQGKRPTRKTVYTYVEKKRTAIRMKDYWVFPRIQSTTAYNIVRKVLGDGWYPHFLRLNRLTTIGSDPSASLTRLKSWSGIKSVKTLQKYLGTSEREQDKAVEFVDEEYTV